MKYRVEVKYQGSKFYTVEAASVEEASAKALLQWEEADSMEREEATSTEANRLY